MFINTNSSVEEDSLFGLRQPVMIAEGREPFRSEPQYASDNEEDDEQIENSDTGVIQDMQKFATALTSEEADPIHGGRDDEAVGDGDNLEEEMDDIDCDTAAVTKDRVATSARDSYESRNINLMIWFFENL